MNFSKITRAHVLDAIAKIESEGTVLEPSTRFDVVINGKTYPPKEVMRTPIFKPITQKIGLSREESQLINF